MNLDEKPIQPSSFFLVDYNPGEKPDDDGVVRITMEEAVAHGYLTMRKSNSSPKKNPKMHSTFERCPYCGVRDPGLKYHSYQAEPFVDWGVYPPFGVWECAKCGAEMIYVVPWPDSPLGRGRVYTLPAFMKDGELRKLNDMTRSGNYFMEVPEGTPKCKS